MKGLITKSTGLWYTVKVENEYYEARLRGKFKLLDKKLTNPVAVGDFVEIAPNGQADGEWVIVEIYPRKNYLIRRSPRKKNFDHLLATNIDLGILIVTLRMPRTSHGFIDRFLVSLEAFRIPALILFNKKDLYQKKDLLLYKELKAIYEETGYDTLLTSFTEDQDLTNIKLKMEGKTCLLSGHSGAGKSTLINLLVPKANQEIREVSSFANKGVHTTTFAELFEMGENTFLIDTPGIKELGLSEIEDEELSHYFPEMRNFLGQCKFHNCKHENEPGCMVKKEVGQSISKRRYESYLSILQNQDDRK